MAGYSTQYTITLDELAQAVECGSTDALIAYAERMVRGTLAGALAWPPAESDHDVPSGDVVVGWLAHYPAVPATRHLPPRPERFTTWAPGEDLPAEADAVVCRGRRIG